MAQPWEYLINSLETDQEKNLASDPYYTAGRALEDYRIPQDTEETSINPWARMALQIMGGFGSGIMKGYGEKNASSEMVPKYRQVLEGAGAKDTGFLDNTNLYESGTKQQIIQALDTQNRGKEQQDQILGEAIKSKFSRGSNGGNFELVNNPDGTIGVKLGQAMDRGSAASNVTNADLESPLIRALASGKPTAHDKYKLFYADNIAQGQNPTQAATEARLQVAAEAKANAGSFDSASVARTEAKELFDLAATAKAGMSKAGQTGSKLASMYEKALSTFAPWSTPEADAQSTGDALIQSIAPQLVKANRAPGAVSDYENKMIIGAGPSITNTPEANAELVKKMEYIAQIKSDYADFVDTFREANNGSTVGADKLWMNYKIANPLAVMGPDGTYQVNPSRPSWQEFFSNPNALAAQADPVPPSMGSGGVPGVGQDFNGTKVIRVTRKK